MKVLSLFDGMSVGRIALERLGVEVDEYYASEIKPHAIKVTQDNYPDTIQIGDVTKVRFEDGVLYTEFGEFDVGEFDLLIGGSPCQGFSYAGKQLNFDDERSKLFFEYERLLNEIKPKHFLLENVRMKKEHQDVISNLLNVEPIVINSKLFSGQLRHRLYWTNIPVKNCIEDKNIKLQSILTEGYTEREKARCLLEGDSRPLVTPLKMFHRHFSTGFHTLIFKSKEHYENCKEHYNEYFKGMSAKEIDKTSISSNVYDGVRYLNQTELERLQTVPEGYTSSVTRNQAASLLGDGWTADVIAHIFSGLKDGDIK